MINKSLLRLFSLVLVISIVFLVSGCKKKQTVAEPFKTVTPKISAEESVTSINNNTDFEPANVETKKSIVFTPKSDLQYAHHAQITYFKDKFYAFFSASPVNEEDPGQQIMMSCSEDGIEWSEAVAVAVPDVAESGVKQTFITQGTYINDGKLFVGYLIMEWPKSLLGPDGLRAQEAGIVRKGMGVVSTKDGKNWEKGSSMAVTTPISLNTGRLIDVGGAYTDDLTREKWEFFRVDTSKAYADGATTVAEPHLYQTDDGIVHILFRTNIGYLYGAESYDGGATWSEMYKTGFTTDDAMFKFGRLSDGRYYWVGNPVADSNRTPLMLCISDDGVNFDKWYVVEDEYVSRMYYDGLYKSGDYAYPTVIEKDGYLYVIYTQTKETVAVTRITLSSLDKAKFVKKTPDSEIYNTNLEKWKSATGKWTVEKGLGYLVTPTVKANLSFSDTKVEKGESFTYEADIKYLGDTATPTGIIGLVFGATNSTQKTKDFTKETYYYLAIDLSNSFTRIFTMKENEFWRRGCVMPLNDHQKYLENYHLKLEMDGKTNMVSYYLNGEFVNKVYLEEFSGGYFGLYSYNTGLVFNNVKLKSE